MFARFQLVIASLLVASLTMAPAAEAGNEDAYALGNQAGSTAGAVTAVTRDCGAVWYNPAGLGGLERSKLDISASAWVLRVRRMPELLVTDLESGHLVGGIDEVTITSVPTGLVYVRNLGKRLSGGIGIYVPESDSLTATSSLGAQTTFADLPGVLVDYRQRVEISWERSKYYIGAALGWRILPNLRIGFSLFVTVGFDDERFLTLGEGHNTEDPSDQRFSMRQYDRDATSVGARGVLGVQYQPHDRVSLAFVLRTPELSGYRWGRRATMYSITPGLIAGELEGGLLFETENFSGGGIEQVAPWRFHVAAAVHFRRGWLGVEADFQAPLQNDAFNIDRGWVSNIRIGTYFQATETLFLGGGLFSDLAGDRPLTSIGSWRVNFYGGTVGGELRTPIALRRRSGPRTLIFSTTVALRYAIGLGESLGYSLAPQTADNPGFIEHRRDVTFHELTAHIGSSFFF